ncbi:MAG: ApeI family dehydratase [Gammaproteobacteria bacterium]
MELPFVLNRWREAERVRLELDIRAELKWFEGHFPGHPVLPGVVQIAWAVHFSRESFDYGPQIRSIEQIKFKQLIYPNRQMSLSLRQKQADNAVDFEYYDASSSFASGILRFMDFT